MYWLKSFFANFTPYFSQYGLQASNISTCFSPRSFIICLSLSAVVSSFNRFHFLSLLNYNLIIHRFEEKFKGVVKKSSKILKKPIDKFKIPLYNKDKFKEIEPKHKAAATAKG